MVGRIIHCSDLILRINETHEQDIGNLTEWILASTEFRPVKPETCEIRDELDSHQKVVVIVMIWSFLMFLSIFYCYFCEQKLFPSQKLFNTCVVDRYGVVSTDSKVNYKYLSDSRSGFLDNGRCPNQDCNLNNRFPMNKKRQPSILDKFRSSHIRSKHHSYSQDSYNSLDSSSNHDLRFGEFRLLEDQDSDQEYLLKKRNL